MTQSVPLQARQPFKPSELGPPPISTVLLQLIYGLVIPLFTTGVSPDLNAARLAAIELVQSYRPRTQPEVVLVAKIVAFGLAALDNLRTSMAADQAVILKLRLRTNAVALERLAGRNTDTLERLRSGSQPQPAQPLDPWTAVEEADLQCMMENARAMIEAANADLALARAQVGPQAPAPQPATPPTAEFQAAAPQAAAPQAAASHTAEFQTVAFQVAASQAAAPQAAAPQAAASHTAEFQAVAFQVAASQAAAPQAAASQSPDIIDAGNRPLPPFRVPATRPLPRADAVVKTLPVASPSAACVDAPEDESSLGNDHTTGGSTRRPVAPPVAAPVAATTQAAPLQAAPPQAAAPQSLALQFPAPQSSVPQSSVPQSAVPQSAVPQSSAAQSSAAQSSAAESSAPQPSVAQAAADGRADEAAPTCATPGPAAGKTIASPDPAAQTSLTQEQQGKLLWADAMTAVAKEFTSHPENTDPLLRKADAMRASILGSVASELAAQVNRLQSGGDI